MSNSSRSFNFKVVLLGEGGTGKTSLVLRFVEDKFNEKHVTTLQASFMQKKINVGGKRIQLAIWDTAGQERFHALGPIYYRDANGAILVYDITDKDSFQKVKNWVKELKKMLGNDICLSIAGNKTDLEHERSVSREEAEQYAALVGASNFFTSAKNSWNIEELFLDLSERMVAGSEGSEGSRTSPATPPAGGAPAASGRRNVVVVDQEFPSPKQSCCG